MKFMRIENGLVKDHTGRRWMSIWFYRKSNNLQTQTKQLTEAQGIALQREGHPMHWGDNEIMKCKVRMFPEVVLDNHYSTVI
ncbi:hypothetical protein [Vibrio agarivorans]|uniref:hypothetical protein n=1 Tax=Vibrio agarivorans TaxID=153622 RepID=UPI00222FF9E2|nr:hypothetical protein [Vibrio agarivorans]MDN3663728.1 hypothetical protein [Vibrio agarivorans]